MPTAGEALKALYGAYRLARLDAGGMAYFNATIEGFWRSFFAAVLIAPFYAAVLVLRFSSGELTTHPARYAAVEAIAYVIAWVIFPLIMVPIAKIVDRETRYIPYIVAYNWAGVLQYALLLPFSVFSAAGGAGGEAVQLGGLVAFGLVLLYTWFITHTALGVNILVATAIVLLDLVLSLVVNGVTESMLLGGQP